MSRGDSEGERSSRSEERYPPPDWFVETANVTDPDIGTRFEREWPDCWTNAADLLDWEQPYDEVLTAADDRLTWFPGGQVKPSVNCVDRHVSAGRKNAIALRWIGAAGERRSLTYLDLQYEVEAVAAGLRSLGVGPGDVVTLFMPNVPELPVTMLACARLGALHNVVYAGFSADELADRMASADSEYLVTCDGYYRRGSAVGQRNTADSARLRIDADVTAVLVGRLDDDPKLGRDYHGYGALRNEFAGATVEPVAREADAPLFVLYTSGTTGEPDQVTHSTGGYLSYAAWTSMAVLDIKPGDTYWCAADIGWITGHTYGVYGPLALGTTTLLHESPADHQAGGHPWASIERESVDVFYTAPTAVRSMRQRGAPPTDEHDRSSIRLLGTVGEPMDPTTWHWYREELGGGEAPVVDTWWQTETGGIVVATLPALDPMQPGTAGPGVPGISTSVVDADGDPVDGGEEGTLAVSRPWPGMCRRLAAEAREAGAEPDSPKAWQYLTGDRAVRDDDYVTLLGRDADTIETDGNAVGTAVVERIISSLNGVTEAGVVPVPEGKEVVAYVSCDRSRPDVTVLAERVRAQVAEQLSPSVCPDRIIVVPELPKTHSGKVMRRLLADVAGDRGYGDTSALRNPEVVGEIETVTREQE
ncbi:acetate--CoA ligase [Halobacteriales archaeon QS_4_70_19]|nr:MAG: acetate--CoA ligase [Halobacteriales archaeon QS_4_70_19]